MDEIEEMLANLPPEFWTGCDQQIALNAHLATAFENGVIKSVGYNMVNGQGHHSVSFTDQRHDTPANRQMVNDIALSFGLTPIF